MKRLIASIVVVVAFTSYAIFSRGDSAVQTAANTGSTGSGTASGSTTALAAGTQGSTSAGFTDGTYTGSRVSALYGAVQVQVVIQGGRISDVQFLSHPTGRHSDEINAEASPVLIQEAISKQSSNVQVVSGATLTSQAFMESLQSALDQA